MKHKLVVSPTERPRVWTLEEPIEFEGVEAPAGFVFDGASIPAILFLRDIFPHGGRKMFAACLHDWLYRTKSGTREEADAVFYRAMRANGVGKIQAEVLYRGVRLGGWWAWGRNTR